MIRTNVVAGLIAATLLTGCESPLIPGRPTTDVYDFALPSSPPAVMRWPAGSTIAVFVATGLGAERDQLLASAFASGAAAWNEVAHFGEFHLTAAPDAASADVVLTWSDLPVLNTDACRPAFTRAVTTFCIEGLGAPGARFIPFPLTGQTAPSRVRMLVSVLASEAVVPDRVPRLVAHELGHVLGISRHSPNASDLMWQTDPTASRPTVRDIATVQVLYHVRADVTP